MENKPKEVTKRVLLKILNNLDRYVHGIERKLMISPIGGTKLTLDGTKYASKDVDIITPRKDFRVISDFVGNLELKEGIRIDVFPDANMGGYNIPFYDVGAKEYPIDFRNLELISPDNAVFCLTKGLTGRKRDLDELSDFLRKHPVPLDKILKEYARLRIKPKKKDEIRQKLEEFINFCYREQST